MTSDSKPDPCQWGPPSSPVYHVARLNEGRAQSDSRAAAYQYLMSFPTLGKKSWPPRQEEGNHIINITRREDAFWAAGAEEVASKQTQDTVWAAASRPWFNGSLHTQPHLDPPKKDHYLWRGPMEWGFNARPLRTVSQLWMPVPPLNSYMTLSKLLHLPKPWFPHL